MSRALDKRIADLEWAQGARITEAMDDPRLVALAAQLQAGVSIRTFSDDDLDYLIAWRRRQGGDAGIDVAAMSNEELERAADGDETVLARYRYRYRRKAR